MKDLTEKFNDKNHQAEYNFLSAAINGDVAELEKYLSILDGKNPDDIRDENGWTALHNAAWNGHTKAALMLVEAGASIDTTNNDGENAWDLAAEGKGLDTADALAACEKKAHTNAPKKYGFER